MSTLPYITEGWVKFQRFPCKEGFIDYWMGDMADDPNRPEQSRMMLNAFTVYYRLNGGKWEHKEEFRSDFFRIILDFARDYPAEEIWQAGRRQNG